MDAKKLIVGALGWGMLALVGLFCGFVIGAVVVLVRAV